MTRKYHCVKSLTVACTMIEPDLNDQYVDSIALSGSYSLLTIKRIFSYINTIGNIQ